MNQTETNFRRFDQLGQRALIVGGIALAISLAGWAIDSQQFFRSYLTGYMLIVGIALGSASLLMIHHVATGDWGFVIRRPLEAALRTVPLFLVLIVPVLVGMKSLYIWAQPETISHDAILQHKAAYLNVPFFIARVVIYFAIWSLFAHFLSKLSAEQDRSGDPGIKRKFEMISGPGLPIMGLTITFSAVDWVMSLDPHWFSTLFGFVFMVGNVLTTLAVMICLLAYFRNVPPLSNVLRPNHFHDLGNLMMAFVILWAYMTFSQFLIIWSGNLPEEITWYLDRMSTGWQVVGITLVLFHFAVPFLVLLSRRNKQNIDKLVRIAAWMIVMRLLDLIWTIAPTLHHEHFHISWMDIAAPIGIGGIWLWFFLRGLKTRPLMPVNDPRMQSLLEQAAEGGHH